MRMGILAMLGILFMTSGCSVKLDKNKGEPAPPPRPKLSLSDQALSGRLDGQPWSPVYAIARVNSDREFEVTLAGPGNPVTCLNWFPMQYSVQFTVPAQAGLYDWDMSAPVSGSRIVNVIFPYRTDNGGGATTVLAETSVIRVDAFAGYVLKGAVAAQASSSSHSFSFNGVFEARICP